jgi:hypothetical protein
MIIAQPLRSIAELRPDYTPFLINAAIAKLLAVTNESASRLLRLISEQHDIAGLTAAGQGVALAVWRQGKAKNLPRIEVR